MSSFLRGKKAVRFRQEVGPSETIWVVFALCDARTPGSGTGRSEGAKAEGANAVPDAVPPGLRWVFTLQDGEIMPWTKEDIATLKLSACWNDTAEENPPIRWLQRPRS